MNTIKYHIFQTLILGKVHLSQAFNIKRTLDKILVKKQIIVWIICYFLHSESKIFFNGHTDITLVYRVVLCEVKERFAGEAFAFFIISFIIIDTTNKWNRYKNHRF